MTESPTYILGISAFYHDSAAALLRNGHIVAAAQEERFTRIRHDSSFPTNSVNYCLNQAGLTMADITYITFYDKPLLKLNRLLETYKAFAPRGLGSFLETAAGWLAERPIHRTLLNQELSRISPGFSSSKLLFAQHHLSHAASAFYPSPFDNAVVLIIDGIGEWATTTVAIGSPEGLTPIRQINFPHSLGLLYSAFTGYIGGRVGDEYKLMGLAAYGEPEYAELIRSHLVHVKPDGSFRLNMDYFDFTPSSNITSPRFDKLFGGPALKRGAEPTQREMNLAASIQLVMEDIILRMTRSLAKEFPHIPNLCLAGEIAFNRVINTKILNDKDGFKNVWIQPAADDSGGAIGAALCAWHLHMGKPLTPKPRAGADLMQGGFLGPSYSNEDVAEAFDRIGAIYRPIRTEQEVLDRTADALAEGKAVGWFQGRMEFGDRALGARSILGDPRNPDMQKNMSLKTRRTSLRPLAASVARENVGQWFTTDADSPYMLYVAGIQPKLLKKMTTRQKNFDAAEKLHLVRSTIPAVTHVDYTARIHTVHADTNRRFHALLKEFQHKTGCPVLANTVLSAYSQPLVNTPEDAFTVFMSTDLDVLVIEDNVLYKEEQNPALFPQYQTRLARN